MARLRGIKQPHPLGSVAGRSGVPHQLTAESGIATSTSPGVKISALPAAVAATDTDQMEVNQAGTSRRLTLDQVAALVVNPETIDDRVASLLVAGPNVTLDYNDTANTLTIASTAAGGGGGTVTSTSVASANGLAGTVATATTTPAITLSTTVTGMVKGNGTALQAAAAGTDYMTPANVSAAYLPVAGGLLAGPGNLTVAGALTGTTATLSTAIPAASNDTTVPTTAWVRTAATVAGVADLAALKAVASRWDVVIVQTGKATGQWRWHAGAVDTADDATVVTPAGTPAGRYKRICEAGQFNAAWYGAVGDNATDNTTALQAAITAAEAYSVAGTVPPSGGIWGTVHVPAGIYVTGPLTITKPIRISGESRTATVLKLKNAGNGHLFTMTLASSWFAANDFQDFTIDGNRANQSATSCGIYLTSTAWAIGTNYSLGCHIRNVAIHNCRDVGLYIGLNRNDGIVSDSLIYNCGTMGIDNHAFDWRIYSADIGVCAYGYVQSESGGAEVWGCNIYQNTTSAVVIADLVTSYVYFSTCSLDSSGRAGVYIDGNGQTAMTYSFIACHFTRNSSSANNTYPDLQLIDAFGVSLTACTFRHLDATRPSYGVLFGGTYGPVVWQGNHYLTSGDVPWATALTNDFGKIVTVGQQPLATVASLPSPTGLAGSRAFVSDATVSTFASVAVGGGSNVVPVYCNGGGWIIG